MVEVSISAVKFIYLCYTQHAEIAAESYYIKTLLDFNLPRSNLATLYQQAGTATKTSTFGVYSCAMLFRICVVYSSDVGCLRCLFLFVGNAKT